MARRPSAPWDLSNGNQPIDPELTAISALASTGILVHTGAGTAAERTVTGTPDEVTVTSGDGVAGNPTIEIPADKVLKDLAGNPTKAGGLARNGVVLQWNNGTFVETVDMYRVEETTIPGGGTAGDAGLLFSSPVEIVPAPGAGRFIEVISIQLFFDWATAGYDNVGGTEALFMGFPAADQVCADIPAPGLGDAVSDQHRIVYPSSNIPAINAALFIACRVGDWYAAAGDSPLKVRVTYRTRIAEFA